MKIFIQEVHGGFGEPSWVLFSCAAGQGRSRWSGQEAPVVGASYDVELDVQEMIEVGHNATLPDDRNTGLTVEGEMVIVSGLIESRDEDGVTYIRLASDFLLVIESDEELPVGARLRLSVPSNRLELTPFGYPTSEIPSQTRLVGRKKAIPDLDRIAGDPVSDTFGQEEEVDP